jgi:hypothetical protein
MHKVTVYWLLYDMSYILYTDMSYILYTDFYEMFYRVVVLKLTKLCSVYVGHNHQELCRRLNKLNQLWY